MISPLRRSRRYVLAATLLLPVIAGGFVWQHPAFLASAKLFASVIQTLSTQYVDSLPKDSIYLRAARGLIHEFRDPYTELYTPSEAAKLENFLQGNIMGIGVSLNIDSSGVYFKTVLPGTPAALAGLHVGDEVLQVDTTPFRRGMTLQQAVGRIGGPAGTSVHVTVVRSRLDHRRSDTLQFTVVRANIHTGAVPFTLLLDQHIGYIPVRQFSEGVAGEVRAVLDTLQRAGATKFILDLRGNPGGFTNEAVELCGLFLAPGQVVIRIRGRQGESVDGTPSQPPKMPTQPLVVLVDRSTASAAEVTSGALQDHDRAAVIGQPTYGKGVAQNIESMPEGYTLKITTGRWYTPLGRSIQRERQLLPTGEYLEVHPESLETPVERQARPIYKSDMGRTLYGGGGVVPDLVIRDTLGMSAARLFTALGSGSTMWRMQSLLSSYAASLKQASASSVHVTPRMRTTFLRRLHEADIILPPSVVTASAPLLDGMIAERILLMNGNVAEAKRVMQDNDALLVHARTVLRQATDQASVFTLLH